MKAIALFSLLLVAASAIACGDDDHQIPATAGTSA
jgi:hypothetical protein